MIAHPTCVCNHDVHFEQHNVTKETVYIWYSSFHLSEGPLTKIQNDKETLAVTHGEGDIFWIAFSGGTVFHFRYSQKKSII